ncbi:MAG: hypothetical protein WBN03_08805 [Desulfobacterales bacterium]
MAKAAAILQPPRNDAGICDRRSRAKSRIAKSENTDQGRKKPFIDGHSIENAVALHDGGKMAKYFGYTLCILVALFFFEWFQIIDIPFVDIPDFTSGKKVLIEKSEGSLNQRLGD